MHNLSELKPFLIASISYFAVFFTFMKLCDNFLFKSIKRKMRFINNRQKEISFMLFATGFLFFIVSLLLDIKCNNRILLQWIFFSSVLFISGFLWLIFMISKERHMPSLTRNFIRFGAVVLSVLVFLVYFYLYNNPRIARFTISKNDILEYYYGDMLKDLMKTGKLYLFTIPCIIMLWVALYFNIRNHKKGYECNSSDKLYVWLNLGIGIVATLGMIILRIFASIYASRGCFK